MRLWVSTYIKHHEDNSHDFLFVEVVKNLGDAFHNHQVVIGETLEREGVVGQDPKDAHHVVGNLTILDAVVLQEGLDQSEALAVHEVTSEFIGLDHVHQAVREAHLAQHGGFDCFRRGSS